jgi:2-oxoisovalerate dehydrogenase E1 component
MINFSGFNDSDELLIDLYKSILFPRMIEEKMLILLRQGKVSKWFSGIGQEAVSVGVTKALKEDEYILPLHRNLGVFTSRNIPFTKLLAQWQGKVDGFSKGRERSFHFGTNEFHIVGMISHLGAMLGVADGIALADKIDRKEQVTVVFSGEGGTSEGDFHESLNLAAVWDLPVIFVVENNGYGLSTPTADQFRCKQVADKGMGYGIESLTIDGNNILEVYHTVKKLAEDLRKNPRPVLLECMTFRMRGHEEASGTKYVPDNLFELWGQKDPLMNFEQYLLKKGVLDDSSIEQYRQEYKTLIDRSVEEAFALSDPTPDAHREQQEVYAPYNAALIAPQGSESEKRLIDALSDGLRQAMEHHPELIIMGQDIAEYGGVFKITEGFTDVFGKDRVRNTPICESAVVGAGLGFAIKKKKAVVEMQFSDFVSCAFNQIVNNLAKNYYRWGQQADVVVRMPTGAGVNAGPFHSQSTEAWFFHVPGLKLVYPSNPFDAKGLLAASIQDPNPVLFFEHKKLYRSVRGMVPDGYYTLPIGKAHTVRKGEELSIITYGWGVHWSMEYCENHGLDAEIVDLRTLLPWDKETVAAAVTKTGKVLILHEDTLTGGIGAEIAAWIAENCFTELDAPVMRVGGLDTPVPLASALEEDFLANSRLHQALTTLIEY